MTIGAAPLLFGGLGLAAIAAPALVARGGRGMLAVLSLAPAALAAWCLALLPAVIRDGPLHASWQWIDALGLTVDLRVDVLSAVMVLVIALLGVAVLIYSVRYFPPGDDGLPKYAGSLLAFSAAMTGLVLADNLIMLVVCWEATGVLSYLLIAHRVRKLSSRRAATQALMVTTAGGLALLVGVLLLGDAAGTFVISQILADPPGGPVVTVAIALMLAGGISKSAIAPLSFWLPGAMAAPTPASAYLHAATMVKAGIYLFARFAPAFAGVSLWRPTLMLLGVATMLIAAVTALVQRDLKLLLAYGTVSQLGLMTVLTGLGTPAALVAAVAVLLAHAAFKGALFFIVGIIDTVAGSRDITYVSGIGRRMPVIATLTVIAAASMAGVPALFGFVAKEAGYAALLDGPVPAAGYAVALGGVLTVAYAARFCWGALATKQGIAPTVLRARSTWMVAPTAALVAVSIWFGLAPQPLDVLLRRLDDTAAGALAAWHGWGTPLTLTLISLAGGLALAIGQRALERRRGAIAEPGRGAGGAYRIVAAAVDVLAVRVTAGTQRGSLPVSLGAIAVVLVVFPGLVLVGARLRPGSIVLSASVAQGVLMVVAIVLALAVLRVRTALAAVLLAGGVGYTLAVFYLLRGAPDLTLTQMLVETVTLIAAVLVIVRMPTAVMAGPRTSVAARAVRAGLSAAVGLLMTTLALVIPGQRRAAPVLADQLAEIVARGGGRNTVNVILVDTRGWDTFGEISVLVAAVIGVSSLIFRRNPRTSPRRGASGSAEGSVAGSASGLTAGSDSSPWLATDEVPRHSLLLEVATRLIFHVIVMFSLYVLFVGHHEPGGGFAAGLIAGIALTLRYLAGGRHELGEAAPVDAGVVMGSGLVIAAASAAAGLIAGRAALTSWMLDWSIPGIGDIHLTTSTVFDIGVYVVVIGMVLEMLRSLGGELDRQGAAADRSDSSAEAAS